MDKRALLFTEILGILREEEEALTGLVSLAIEEQSALIDSDFERITQVSNRMMEAAAVVERFETRRLSLLTSLDAGGLSLEELQPVADELGVSGFTSVRMKLRATAQELKTTQEQNARLLLHAIKLRDRWANLLGGLVAPGYGSDGRRDAGNSRGTVSRTA